MSSSDNNMHTVRKLFVWCILGALLVNLHLFSEEFHFDEPDIVTVVTTQRTPDRGNKTRGVIPWEEPVNTDRDTILVTLSEPSALPTEAQPRYPTSEAVNLGKHWKREVAKKFNEQQKIRWRSTKPKTLERKQIAADFKRLRNRLDEIDVDWDINNPRSWHSVTVEGYRETVEKARSSMDEMVAQVYTDCILWLVPSKRVTAMEIEIDDRNKTIKEKNAGAGPDLRFQCGNNKRLQREPCYFANLCLVRSDFPSWREYYASPKSYYNHTQLEERLMPKTIGSGSSSAILTMVDSIQYLRHGKISSPKMEGRGQYFIWECFLNKAGYALQTNREFYLWIGGFEKDEILHQRNIETISRTFGTHCNPESATKNVVHYYKPIAFGAFFHHKKKLKQSDSDSEHRVWFVDADIFFNSDAFPFSTTDDGDGVMSLDDYFDLSPQASLLGSQNPSGKKENILINGGLLGLRSRPHSSNDWILDFSALWWYCRCGERDQIALWLLLFATWSAESSENNSGDHMFSYPGVVFENYFFAWYAVIPHARTLLPQLQEAWARNAGASDRYSWSTAPINTDFFNGGDGFLNSTMGGMFTRPLELPHVLLLPLDPFVIPSSVDKDREHAATNGRTNFYLAMARKNQAGKKALLTHNKNMINACYNLQCWPFLIRQGPSGIIVPSNKNTTRTNE